MGNWSAIIISIAAFSTMFGTSITLADGYCRAINRTVHLLKKQKEMNSPNNQKEEGIFNDILVKEEQVTESKKSYLVWVLVLFTGSYILIYFVGSKLSNIMNLATGTSFMIAPIAAYFNYKIVFSEDVPRTLQPSLGLKWLAITGLCIITSFSLGYLYILFTL